jgi:flavin reductase (DIM6/NTAB) family NADH-FMN oxidoreductase RutF
VLELLPPYPIVLVTTRSNVITINQIAYFTFRPLRIGIGVAHSRHTHELLRAEREFVVNVPDSSLLDAVRVCGSLSGRDGDKFEAAGLEREASVQVGAVGLPQCGAQIECHLDREIPFEHRDWFIGEVVAVRRRVGHTGANALMCGRHAYLMPGAEVAPR